MAGQKFRLFCRVYMKQITVLLVTNRPVVHETQTGHPMAASVKKTSSVALVPTPEGSCP
jgi:hypothetical protein